MSDNMGNKYHRLQLIDGYIDIPHNNYKPVVKCWVDSESAEKEFSALKFMNSVLKEESVEGWKYKTVVPYRLIDKCLYMQKATGNDLRNYILDKPILSKQAGIWLAIYHNKTLHNGRIKIFGDYSPNNIMIDLEKKIVVALDPGYRCGQEGYPELDLVKYLLKTTIFFLANKKLPFESLKSFLTGYYSCGKQIFDLRKFDESFHLNKIILKQQWKKKNLLKRIMLSPFLKITKIYLKYIIIASSRER